MKQRMLIIVALLIAGLPPCTGCGDKRPAVAPVSGRVTCQGKPVVAGRIMFYPENGRPAVGQIGPDGTYQLTTNPECPGDGALLGRHRVTIEATRLVGGRQPKSFADEQRAFNAGVPNIEWLVPEKYSRLETTTLTAEVKPGDNVVNFDL
jgi:hypothetical protein